MATTHQNLQLSVPEHGNNIVTNVGDLNYPSRFIGEVTWKRTSPFLRVSNSANFRSAARFAYDTTDSESNQSFVNDSPSEMEGNENTLDKLKSFGRFLIRIGRITCFGCA